VQVFGRLADGASWQDAASELDVASARLAADEPGLDKPLCKVETPWLRHTET
jgi:hypothetical protein